MNEISCRAYSFFVSAERAGVCNIDELIEGLPLTREFLENASNRMPWDSWAIACDRFANLFDTEEAIFDAAKYAINDSFSGYLAKVPDVFVDEESIYRVGFRWVVPRLFQHIDLELSDVVNNSFTVSAKLRPNMRGSLGWFQLFTGTIPLVPLYIGLKPASYEIVELTARQATVMVHLKAKNTTTSWWQRLGRAALEKERAELRDQLHASFGAMHAATESFRNLLDGMPAVVVAVNEDLVTYVNSTYESLSRRSPLTEGDKIHELFAEEDRGTLEALFRGELHEAMLRLPSNDPTTTVVLSARLVRGIDFKGAPTDLLVGIDITADSIIRANLERSEATMSAMLRAQPELIFRLDNKLMVLDVKPGSDIEESSLISACVGRHIGEAFSAMPANAFPELRGIFTRFTQAVTQGEQFEESMDPPNSHGQYRHLTLRVHPLLDGRESVVVVRDETSRAALDQRLRVAERMASVGTLAAGIAHEINNPLAYVSMNVELLKEEISGLPQDVQHRINDLLAGVADGTERIQHIIQPLRQMSRIEARQVVPVSVKKALDAALATTEHQCRHGAKVFLELEEEVPDILGDRTEVVQVFVNLLVNACNAMETPKAQGEHELYVRLFSQGDEVIFEIQDTGVGISEENLQRIFNPFFSTRMRETGTGLGLSIVHSIVTDMNGTIQVDSKEGRGTTFRLEFTALEAIKTTVQPAAVVPQESTEEAARKANIIVIDDEPMIRKSMARVLANHDVTCFGSGAEALEYLSSNPTPDLVLCDITMPGMSGLELFSRLEENTPNILDRMVFVTGGAFTPQTENFLKRTDINCLYKPVMADVLRKLATDSVSANADEAA